jgi:hypothetical protein
MSPFDFINSVSHTKKNLMAEGDTLAEKDYNPFMVNRGLSYYKDTIFPANEMNLRYGTDKACQYAYLLNILAPRKRFSKWFKEEKLGDLEIVKEYYGFNNNKAKEVLDILTPEQLSILKERLFKGGKNEFRSTIP